VRITADTGRCVGAGQCVLAAPQVFDQDEAGIVTIMTANPDHSTVDIVREAVAACPSMAIAMYED
jgi:ferredoxin